MNSEDDLEINWDVLLRPKPLKPPIAAIDDMFRQILLAALEDAKQEAMALAYGELGKYRIDYLYEWHFTHINIDLSHVTHVLISIPQNCRDIKSSPASEHKKIESSFNEQESKRGKV